MMNYWLYKLPGLLLFVGLLLTCQSCDRTQRDNTDLTSLVVRSHQQSEGIELTAEIWPARLRLSDELTLKLTIRKHSELQTQPFRLEEALSDFVIRDVQNPLPKLENEFEVVETTYHLEPRRTGKLAIILPAVEYDSKDATPQTSAARIIETDPLEIEVSSDLNNQTASLELLRPETQPVDLPDDRRGSAVWIAIVAVAISILAAAVAIYRKRQTLSVRLLTPLEQARFELQQLVQANWAKLDPKRYFVELTAIVRRYIERTTGVRAPEQTTEEFLRTIASDRIFSEDVQQRMREFLESADLVKFAGLQPSDKDISLSLDRANRFIESELVPRPGVDDEELKTEYKTGLAQERVSE